MTNTCWHQVLFSLAGRLEAWLCRAESEACILSEKKPLMNPSSLPIILADRKTFASFVLYSIVDSGRL
jgi:hypothetical protein